MTGIQSLLVRIYGYSNENKQPWGIVKVVGESEEHHFHNRGELLDKILEITTAGETDLLEKQEQ
ncbi:MAG: hypothetical protein V3W04_08805 [Gammaproteobacteria bacterium]